MPHSAKPAYRPTLMEDPRHLMRWLKAQAVGGSEEAAARAVAQSEHITIETARASIREVDAYRKRNDKVEFDYAIRDLVISAIPQAKETLNGLLAATELVEVKDHKTGTTKIVEMEDKTTRLEAFRALSTLTIGLQPKTPMIEQNISQTTQVAAISSGTETNEERLKRLRQQAAEYRALPPEVIAVPDYVDAGEEDSDEDDEEGDE